MVSEKIHANKDRNDVQQSHFVVKIKPQIRVKKLQAARRHVKRIPSRVYVKKTQNHQLTKTNQRTSNITSSPSRNFGDSLNDLSQKDRSTFFQSASFEENDASDIIVLFENIITLLEGSLTRHTDETQLVH